MNARSAALALALALLAPPATGGLGTVKAVAQEAPINGKPSERKSGGSQPETAQGPDCTCRAFGRNYTIGATICLKTPEGPRVFACGFDLNNTSWKPQPHACVES